MNNIAKPKNSGNSQLGLPSKRKTTSKICLQKNDDVAFEA